MKIRPLVTEKSLEKTKIGKYSFIVETDNNKSEVIKEISKIYGVKPLKANTVNRKGKLKKSVKSTGKRKDRKIIVITLDKKEKIEGFEPITEDNTKENKNKNAKKD